MVTASPKPAPPRPSTIPSMFRPGNALPVSEYIAAYESMLDAGTLELDIADAFTTIDNHTKAMPLETSGVSASKRTPSDVKAAAKPKAGTGSVFFAGAIGHLALRATAFETLDRVFMPP